MAYKEVSSNIFIGQKSSTIVVNQNLKNDIAYKSDKLKCAIEIYHGNVVKI